VAEDLLGHHAGSHDQRLEPSESEKVMIHDVKGKSISYLTGFSGSLRN
jgi:hypothetical protein